MESYSDVAESGSKALDAVTPIKLFTARATGSIGWRLYNPSATLKVLTKVVRAGATAPTYAEMVAGVSTYRLAPLASVDDGADSRCDVYGCVVSGTLTVYPQELF